MDEKRYEPDRIHKILDWRVIFEKEILEEGEKLYNSSVIREITAYYGNTFEIKTGKIISNIRIYRTPAQLTSSWKDAGFECSACKRGYYNSNTGACRHAAAALIYWEKKKGPWTVWEDDYAYRLRKESEALEAERLQREKQRRRIGLSPVPLLEAFKSRVPKGAVYFDMEGILAPYVTTAAAQSFLQSAKADAIAYRMDYKVYTSREGEKWIRFEQGFEGKFEYVVVWGTVANGQLKLYHALKQKKGRYSVHISSEELEDVPPKSVSDPFDEYDLYTLANVWDIADKESAKSITDEGAEKFFKSIQAMREENARRETRSAEPKVTKKPVIEILPRIVLDFGSPVLSFKIGVTGGRKYIVKDCYSLFNAVTNEEDFVLGKKETLHFAEQEFTQEAAVLYDFIQRNRADSFNGIYQVNLEGSRLDNFYDMYSGECELLDRTNNIKD